ncbi:hypothetical protein ACPCXE_17585 [Bacillus velezensis]|uniref:hypothetical protein n=1 Tax=Bacillus velezensis TaxID=492670 RepID=UPI0029C735F3|nr:hypothetical protein [Bacillus velezensis]WPF80665.1 hypothetical protein SCZ87_11975 [Bacillus velezensis]
MQKVNWSEQYEWFNKQDEKDGRLMALLRHELTYEEVIRLYKKGFYLKSKEGDVRYVRMISVVCLGLKRGRAANLNKREETNSSRFSWQLLFFFQHGSQPFS